MPQRIFESAEGLQEVRDNYHKLFGHDASILHTGTHSIYGTTVFHCEVCPIANGESCSLSCCAEREKQGFPKDKFGEDGIKVY